MILSMEKATKATVKKRGQNKEHKLKKVKKVDRKCDQILENPTCDIEAVKKQVDHHKHVNSLL
jgi:hypothetical protein